MSREQDCSRGDLGFAPGTAEPPKGAAGIDFEDPTEGEEKEKAQANTDLTFRDLAKVDFETDATEEEEEEAVEARTDLGLPDS